MNKFLYAKKISLWVRLLVILPFFVFVEISLLLMLQGKYKAAAGAFIVAALISPLLIELIRPGRYVLRKPDDQVAANLINRLKQFRIAYPGRDGTVFLVTFAFLGTTLLASALARPAHLFGIR